MKNNWKIVCKTVYPEGRPILEKQYVFGNIYDTFTKEEMKDRFIVPYSWWKAEDFVEILCSELKSANYHNLVDMPKRIFKSIENLNLAIDMEDVVMNAVCQSIYDSI